MKKEENKKARGEERRKEKIKKDGLLLNQEKSSRPFFLTPHSLI